MAYDGSIKIDTSIDGKGFSRGMNQLGSIASGVLKGTSVLIAGATAALSAGAFAGAKYNAQMEQYITSFGTMLGSADKAQKMIANIKKFAAETPFELPDLAKGAQTLLAFGTAEEKIMPTMKMIGDVAQGNKEKFDRLTLAFAQISSTGRLMGQDLLQCINSGFNPLNEISKMTGKSVAQLKDEMSKGAISADMVADAFKHATAEGGQFYNAMESQSKTFNGQLSTMKDTAISFLGELTQRFSDDLKDSALPMVNDWLSELQGAFHSGGAVALTRSFGDVLAKAVSAVAEQAPGVIESASEIISAFVRGIQKNLPKLADSALEIVSALVKGIAKIFPREITKPISEAMDAIEKSFRSGGLKNAIDVFKKMLSSLGDVIGKIAKTVLPIFTAAIDALGSSMKVLVPIITASVAAVTTWKIAQQASTWIAAASKAITALSAATVASTTANGLATASLTLSHLAYGTLTGSITLASAAQAAFNMILNANPIGIAVTAAAGLTAAVIAFTMAQREGNAETQESIETANAFISATQDRIDSMENLKLKQAESIQGDLSQIGNVERLSAQLHNLANINGIVGDADKARAQFILGELNTALGTEYTMTGNQIANYQNLQGEISRTIELKRAELMLSAYEAVYTDAINKRASAEQSAAQSKIAISQTEQQIADLRKNNYNDYAVLMEAERLGITDVANVYDSATAQRALALQRQLNDLDNVLTQQTIAYNNSSTELDGYYATIAGYENAATLVLSGNVSQAISSLERQSRGFSDATATVGTSTQEQKCLVAQQYAESIISLDNYSSKYKSGVEGYTKEGLEQQKKYTEECAKEAETCGVGIIDGTVRGINGKKINLTTEISNLKDSGIKIVNDSRPMWYQLGADCGQGYANGIASMVGAVEAAGKSLVAAGSQKGIKKTQKSNSPSKLTRGLGNDFGDGYVFGIKDRAKSAEAAGKELFSYAAQSNPSKEFINNMRASVQAHQSILGGKLAASTAYQAAQYTAKSEQPATAAVATKQEINFNYPMQAPDEIARALRLSARHGLQGART